MFVCLLVYLLVLRLLVVSRWFGGFGVLRFVCVLLMIFRLVGFVDLFGRWVLFVFRVVVGVLVTVCVLFGLVCWLGLCLWWIVCNVVCIWCYYNCCGLGLGLGLRVGVWVGVCWFVRFGFVY